MHEEFSSALFRHIPEGKLQGVPPFNVQPHEMETGQFQRFVEAYVVEHNERASSIELRECGEPLVDITKIPYVQMLQSIPELDTPADEIPPLIRQGIAERLERVQKQILQYQLGLKVFYGLRPLRVQKRYIDVVLQRVRAERPDLVAAGDEGAIARLSTKYVAPLSFAPHCTGAAADLCLYNIDSGEELDYGTAFPQFIPETMTEHPAITGEARQNRIALRALMAQEGFWNFPGEWWHFSWGDRAWASYTNQSYAVYGPVSEAAEN